MEVISFEFAVERALSCIMAPPNKGFSPEDYIGGGQSRLRFFGLKIPQVRSFLKTDPLMRAASWPQIQALWRKSPTFEGKALALFWLEAQPLQFLCSHSKEIAAWIRQCKKAGIPSGEHPKMDLVLG
jgi:hypothetical protein